MALIAFTDQSLSQCVALSLWIKETLLKGNYFIHGRTAMAVFLKFYIDISISNDLEYKRLIELD